MGGIFREGQVTLDELLTRIAYDQNNTRLALSTSGTTGGVYHKVDFIYNYTERILYTIEGGNCIKTPLTQPFERLCTPKDAVMTWGKTWLGGAGPNDELWILGFTGQLNNISYHMSFSQFPIIPVFETLIGDINGDPMYQNSNFMNVTVGIQDPAVFTPPPLCKAVDVKPPDSSTRRSHGILKI
ncbi:mammalian ependymin-related protein 1-like [Haliotis rubra]|uniref:mammalian ependymin-related protein 1-like n=1 Tax=Haliotis rubra TaxID=36100 RepID=UPI001EE595FC|nr:mammalian ependymin-related protein 1-like [Haliotis rubra]